MRRNRQKNNVNWSGRETLRFAKTLPPAVYLKKRADLSAIEDRRTFHPDGVLRPPRMFKSWHSRFDVRPSPKTGSQLHRAERIRPVFSYEPAPIRIGFIEPRKVLVCVRRKIRREVMHAFGIAGKRGIGRGGSRRNEFSSVSC